MWIWWILSSAVFLAFYDLAKKASVRENAVLPVLLVATLFGAAAFALAVAITGDIGKSLMPTGREFALVFVKGLIVSSSWVCTYYALRSLPITIATPIRASSPALVFVIAFFLYGEMPTCIQGIGMALVFAGYWAFSWAGKHEGIDFLRNRAVYLAVAGMILSAGSSIWDKFILQKCGLPVERMQFWFQIDLVLIYAALLLLQRTAKLERTQFKWRWTIPMVGILLAAADWLYFNGLAIPDVPISVASLMRRFSVVITFALGAICFHETNLRRKSVALAAILIGIILLCI